MEFKIIRLELDAIPEAGELILFSKIMLNSTESDPPAVRCSYLLPPS